VTWVTPLCPGRLLTLLAPTPNFDAHDDALELPVTAISHQFPILAKIKLERFHKSDGGAASRYLRRRLLARCFALHPIMELLQGQPGLRRLARHVASPCRLATWLAEINNEKLEQR